MQISKILIGIIAAIFLTTSSVLTGAVYAQNTVTINGAGATFPFPLIDTWRVEYQKVHPETNINYQSIGSGGGIKQFTAKTVDFGATDAPLSQNETQHAQGVVHRSDGSGTTFVWTDYLSSVSPAWKEQLGKGKSVQWPVGIGAPGNEGVANAIKGSPNTIGYIELGYALTTKTPFAFVQNKEGKFVEPSLNSTKAAVEANVASLPKGDGSWTNVTLVNAAGADSYPIASLTYLLLYKEMSTDPNLDQAKAKALVDFISWAITDGQKMGPSLGYVPLPDGVVKLDQDTLKSLTFKGQPIS